LYTAGIFVGCTISRQKNFEKNFFLYRKKNQKVKKFMGSVFFLFPLVPQRFDGWKQAMAHLKEHRTPHLLGERILKKSFFVMVKKCKKGVTKNVPKIVSPPPPWSDNYRADFFEGGLI
jgi:hypothetical protein